MGRRDIFIEADAIRKLVLITLRSMNEEAEEICRRKLSSSSGIMVEGETCTDSNAIPRV
jgi:hypothetical protein